MTKLTASKNQWWTNVRDVDAPVINEVGAFFRRTHSNWVGYVTSKWVGSVVLVWTQHWITYIKWRCGHCVRWYVHLNTAILCSHFCEKKLLFSVLWSVIRSRAFLHSFLKGEWFCLCVWCCVGALIAIMLFLLHISTLFCVTSNRHPNCECQLTSKFEQHIA